MTPTNQHPITPPPELIEDWIEQFKGEHPIYIATHAAQWGADQELEACCEQIDEWGWEGWSEKLLITRRPKPPSLKEQALTALLHLDHGQHNERYLIIRRALEQLDD
ncbi:MAG: hypothetical protein ACO3CQ_02805 [Candidatus Nanopelagicaceae bacterium]